MTLRSQRLCCLRKRDLASLQANPGKHSESQSQSRSTLKEAIEAAQTVTVATKQHSMSFILPRRICRAF